MKKFQFWAATFAISGLLCAPVRSRAADNPWKFIASSTTGKNTTSIYLRLGMIRIDPNNKERAQVWQLYNNSLSQTTGFISYKSEVDLQEFDCSASKMATLSQNLYDGEMGSGKALSSESVQGAPAYGYPVPDTLGYAAMQAACAAIGHPI